MASYTADDLTANARRNGVPEHLIDGLVLYVTQGIPPGHFLTAVLENNLMDTMRRADERSLAGLFAVCTFVYNWIPGASHGNPILVAAWIAHGGIRRFDTQKAGA